MCIRDRFYSAETMAMIKRKMQGTIDTLAEIANTLSFLYQQQRRPVMLTIDGIQVDSMSIQSINEDPGPSTIIIKKNQLWRDKGMSSRKRIALPT